MKSKWIFLIGYTLLSLGCQGNEVDKLKADLQKFETRLKSANTKIEALQSRNNNLKRELEKAKFKYENIKIQNTEIDEWIISFIKELGPCVWVVGQFEKPVPHEIVKNGKANDLINKLNTIFNSTDSPEAALLKIENETAYIKIKDEEKLTQEMGTSGAASYINSIVYTLFSIKSINCIDIDFEEGDHAFPGTYCPEQDYKDANKST